jgi:hypothetical protein
LKSCSITIPSKLLTGDVDPWGEREHCDMISDKVLAIGGGVLDSAVSISSALTD